MASNRNKRLIIPVTEEEREYIKRIAKSTYYKTSANFCRELIFQACDYLDTLEEVPDRVFEIVPTPDSY